MVIQPSEKIHEWFTIIVLYGIREELLFRFCILGVLVSSTDWIEAKQWNKIIILFLFGFFFAILHGQYQTISALFTLSIMGFVFGFLFIGCGIVTAIVAHSIWNFYFNIYILMPLIVLSALCLRLGDRAIHALRSAYL
jgi:membrane protease YdiL (CAAX protease family)